MKIVADLYPRNATLFNEQTAYIYGARRISHGQLFDRVRTLASAIYRSGGRHQHRMGIVSANCLAYYELYGACEHAGYIIANYNFRSAGPELAYLVADSTPTILFFAQDLAAVVDQIRSQIKGVRRYVCIGDSPPEWAVSYDDFITEGEVQNLPFGPRERDYVHLFYTSGTTGRPKGVTIRQNTALITAERQALEEDMCVLQISPGFHVAGRGQPLGAFWNGGKVLIEAGFDPTRFLELVQEERVNATFMVPPMMQAVLDHPDFALYDLSSLRWVMAASTKIPAPLLARAREKIGPFFYAAYGLTECGAVARMKRSDFQSDGTADGNKRLESVGQIEPFVSAAILDEEGAPVAPGDVGEVCVQTYWWSGYWNNDAATLEAMHGDYVRTGDLGYLDPQGFLFLVDRKKDMIISGGENIYSREVEDAIQYHPDVSEIAVIGEPDPKWGESVCAIVVLRDGATVGEEELITFAKTRIARYKCPRRIVFLPDMPRIGTGKIDKALLRRTYALAPESAA